MPNFMTWLSLLTNKMPFVVGLLNTLKNKFVFVYSFRWLLCQVWLLLHLLQRQQCPLLWSAAVSSSSVVVVRCSMRYWIISDLSASDQSMPARWSLEARSFSLMLRKTFSSSGLIAVMKPLNFSMFGQLIGIVEWALYFLTNSSHRRAILNCSSIIEHIRTVIWSGIATKGYC